MKFDSAPAGMTNNAKSPTDQFRSPLSQNSSSPPHRQNSSSSSTSAANHRFHHKGIYHHEKEGSRQFLREFFNREPCLYSHKVYKQASVIFDALKLEARVSDPLLQRLKENNAQQNTGNKEVDVPHIEFDSDRDKQLAYELVFQTLKYQRFLEDILEDCSFFHQYPELRDDHGLVMVMVNDFKKRKFQSRTPIKDEICDPFLTDIEHGLIRTKTKLNAALARRRIKAQVLSIDDLLPKSVRQKDKDTQSMHVYCWVNQLKTNINIVLGNLQDEGFSAVYKEIDLQGPVYMRDSQCNDAIILPSEQRNWIQAHPMVLDGHLVLQDRSSCVGPHCIQYIINEGDDVIQLNIGSGLSTAHLASLIHQVDATIYAFGIVSEKQHNQVMYNLDRLGASGRVKLMSNAFEEIDPNDERFKNIKIALMSAECSRSGVTDPVNFLVTEGEDLGILKSISQGNNAKRGLGDFVMKHNKLLSHLLKFSKIQGVIYCTRSVNESENESVVTSAIEHANLGQQKKNAATFRVSPPTVPLTQMEIEGENANLTGKYLKYKPSAMGSGCFVATITREAVDIKESAKEVLARAAKEGLISGVPAEVLQKTVKSKSETGGAPSTKSRKNKKSIGGGAKQSKSHPQKDLSSSRKKPVGARIPTSHTMSVPHATTITPFTTNSPTPSEQPRHPVTPRTFPAPLFNQEVRPRSTPLSSPPEHRKVVQHPKPFSNEKELPTE